LEFLLEKRRDLIDLTDHEGNNAMHYAAQDHQRSGQSTVLAYKRNLMSMSPLHIAAQYGSTDAIKALPGRCRDGGQLWPQRLPRLRHQRQGERAQVRRCLLRRVRPAELLNQVDANGDTPLHLEPCPLRAAAAQRPRVDPCVPVPDRNGHTPRSLLEKKWNADEIDTSEVRSTFGISSRSKSP
jgi:hypothetical protein